MTEGINTPLRVTNAGAAIVEFSRTDLQDLTLAEVVEECLDFAYAMGAYDAMNDRPGSSLDMVLAAGRRVAAGRRFGDPE